MQTPQEKGSVRLDLFLVYRLVLEILGSDN